nr:ABC transporter permease [Tissierella sp.]
MNLKEIAKRGLKGRKKDTLLISLVITLSFIFIITSTIFKSSTEKTKLEQGLDLYGEYHASYLQGDEEILKKLQAEDGIDKIGKSLIVGESERAGVVGSFDEDLLDMGRFTFYKGSYPKEDNEIMLEINQMSKMGLELEIGQEISVDIKIPTTQGSLKDYIKTRSQELIDRGYKGYQEQKNFNDKVNEIFKDESTSEEEKQVALDELYESSMMANDRVKYYKQHETPYEKKGDTTIIVSNDYIHYYIDGDEVDPEIIKKDGFNEKQEITISKDFIVTGILNTYTDKWALDEFQAANSFIRESAAKSLKENLYNSELVDLKDHKMYYNIFLQSSSLGDRLYSSIDEKYLASKELVDIKDETSANSDMFSELIGAPAREIDEYFKAFDEVKVGRVPDETKDKTLEGNAKGDSKVAINESKFRKNYLAFGTSEDNTDRVLDLTIIAIIFIATALAIFQIFLTQMKRRSRKLVLLRSIGATKKQIIKIIFYEGLHFLRNGLLIGVPTGLISSLALVWMMNRFGGRDLQFFINPKLLITGILAGVVSLFAGMIVPIFYAVNIPLVGTISKPPKRKKKDYKGDREVKYQNFKRINLQNLKVNRGKTILSFGICFIAITILLSSLMLVFTSFNDYKKVVVEKDRPSFAMETFYGESAKELKNIEEFLRDIKEVTGVESYKVGKETMLWYDGIEDNQILNDFESLLPLDFKKNYFAKYNSELEGEIEAVKNSFYTKIYGIETDSELFNEYKSMLDSGSIDLEKFKNGEEVIILSPMYLQGQGHNKKDLSKNTLIQNTNEDNRMNYVFKNSDLYDMTYEKRFSDYYSSQEEIGVGDIIRLSANAEEIQGMAYVDIFNTAEVKVAGIINSLPKGGKWPFSNNKANYVILSSIEGMENLYSNSRSSLRYLEVDQLRDLVKTIYPTRYGRTIIYIDTNSNHSDPLLNSKLLSFAHERGYTLYNYNESNSKLFQEAFNNALIIALLALTASSISLLILYNIMVSKMEQDRNRIGILQSLGVTRREFKGEFLKLGFLNALIALVLTHIILFVVLLIGSSLSLKGINLGVIGVVKDIFSYRLWLYPWKVHIVISLIFLILITLIFYLPSRKIINASPVENIRSLSR